MFTNSQTQLYKWESIHKEIADSEEKRSRFKPTLVPKHAFLLDFLQRQILAVFFTSLVSEMPSLFPSHCDHNHKISGNVAKGTDLIHYKWS